MFKNLLVEDDEVLSDSIYEILMEIGTVQQVYNGEEALFEGKTNRYDLIVLDLMLPELSGERVLKNCASKM